MIFEYGFCVFVVLNSEVNEYVQEWASECVLAHKRESRV